MEFSFLVSDDKHIIGSGPTHRLSAVNRTLFNMVKPAHTPPASPRSSVVRKHFDKAPGSLGDELLAAVVFRKVPNEGRIASKTLHLQVHSEDHAEDMSFVTDSTSIQSASSRHTGKSHRSAQSLRTREDLKLQVLRSRITFIEAEGRTLGMTKPKSSRHCQVIAKLAAKKLGLERLLRRRSTDLDEVHVPIDEDIETDTNAHVQAKQRPLGVSVDLGNLRPPSKGSSSSTMPIRKGIVDENRQAFSKPPDIFCHWR